jgi:thiamine kinase
MQSRLDSALDTWPAWLPGLSRRPVVAAPIHEGLTNRSWLIMTERGRAILRINSPHHAIWGIDRERELSIHLAVAEQELAPKILYCDPGWQFLVTEFVEGSVWDRDSIGRSGRELQVLALIQKMQQIELTLPRFDYVSHLEHYRTQLDELGVPVPEDIEARWRQHRDAIGHFQKASWRPVLVHHDLLSGNIIDSPRGLKVIDWEYAALGHGALDSISLQRDLSEAEPVVAVLARLMNDYWFLLHRFLNP